MVRVLMISNNLRMNGISSVIMNYIRNIDLTDLQIDIIAGEPISEEYVNELKGLGCRIYRQDNRKKHPVKYYKNLISIIRKKEYNAIHVHTNSCTCIIELGIAKLFGVRKRIAHCHSRSCQHKLFHKIAYPLFSHLYTEGIACSKEAGVHLFKKRHFTVLNNGLDVNKYAFNQQDRTLIRKKMNISSDSLVIGHVGLFNEEKNQIFLLQTFNKVFQQNKNSYLCFVGTGATEDTIKLETEKYGLTDKVIFLGERNNVNQIYNIFDVFCFPSLYEGFGMVLVEAEANGLSCIASTGVPRVTNFSQNVEYLDLDVDTWVRAISGLKTYENNKTRENNSLKYRSMIADNGYDIEKISTQLRDIYMRNL